MDTYVDYVHVQIHNCLHVIINHNKTYGHIHFSYLSDSCLVLRDSALHVRDDKEFVVANLWRVEHRRLESYMESTSPHYLDHGPAAGRALPGPWCAICAAAPCMFLVSAWSRLWLL